MRSRPWPLAQALAQAAGDGSSIAAWGQPRNAARAFLEELVGKIHAAVSLWARGTEALGPFWWLSALGEGAACPWVGVNEASATGYPSLSLPCRPLGSCER